MWSIGANKNINIMATKLPKRTVEERKAELNRAPYAQVCLKVPGNGGLQIRIFKGKEGNLTIRYDQHNQTSAHLRMEVVNYTDNNKELKEVLKAYENNDLEEVLRFTESWQDEEGNDW